MITADEITILSKRESDLLYLTILWIIFFYLGLHMCFHGHNSIHGDQIKL